MKNSRKKMGDHLVGLVLPFAILVIWFVTTENKTSPSYVFPSTKEFAKVFIDFIFGGLNVSPYSGKMLENLLVSIMRVAEGFVLGSVVGVVLGFLTGRIGCLKKLVDPTVQALKAVPGIGYLPLGMVWFGVGEENTLFLISLAVFFPVYLNTQEGAARVPELYLRAGKMLGAKKASLFFTVVFPATFGQMAVGLRLAQGVAWAYLVLGEMTGVTKGIGAVMMDGRMLGRVDIVIACMIVIAMAGKLCDCFLMLLFRILGGGMLGDCFDAR
ncbi:ABC transporter permease [Lachnospiraceae bacterium LCP25S3_G4]